MRIVISAVILVALCGCGSVDGNPQEVGSTSTPRTTLTDPNLQPPEQSNEGGRLDVVYDPCTWIPDDVIRAAGFDPETRQRNDRAEEATSFGCFFSADGKQLIFVSDNVRYETRVDQFRDRIEQTVSINGRDAILYPDRVEPDTCYAIMRTNVGALVVGRTIFADRTTPCAGMVEFASAFEPTIGEEN